MYFVFLVLLCRFVVSVPIQETGWQERL